ncbi:NAD(P)H-dependent oxidoreductase [Ciceribacter sp. L1K23]|uniref:NADPH-dependent FMN reductase n=1 Tax=Ciceribacter sp. L1K23 TaxID=2820276 RepID=UPI001B8402E6|nr:NADPH-dependent FMN reductase [Ciceribacter sp. L1K23]MBR0554447.1 NAD(P)H-dependent oxidoreductase [Ciceribacter sp. L1K23]
MKKLLFIPGSLRTASASRATVRTLVSKVEGEAACTIADPGNLPHYNADLTDNLHVKEFCDQIAEADGLVFVTPEYNYSIPGVLKNAIDWASRPALESVFKGKPCFIVSISGGALGGVRAQAHLKYILNGMLANVYVCPEIVIPLANQKVSDGHLVDEAVLGFVLPKLRDFILHV